MPMSEYTYITGFQAAVDIDISFINVIILNVKLFFWELFLVRGKSWKISDAGHFRVGAFSCKLLLS